MLVVKNPPASVGDPRDMSSIPGSGSSRGVGNDTPLHCSCLENSIGRGAWWATVHGAQRFGHDRATEHLDKAARVQFFILTMTWLAKNGFKQ